MLSRKICNAHVLDLEAIDDVQDAIDGFRDIGFERVRDAVPDFDHFDVYILRYFFEGITSPNRG